MVFLKACSSTTFVALASARVKVSVTVNLPSRHLLIYTTVGEMHSIAGRA